MNAKEESQELVNALLPFTEQMLEKYGEFYPHGGYMKPGGEIVLVGAADSETDNPKSVDLIDTLRDSLRDLASARKCKAAAIVFDIVLKSPTSDGKTDAIQVCIEHKDGYSAEVFFPYQIVNHRVVFGETFAQVGSHEIFE